MTNSPQATATQPLSIPDVLTPDWVISFQQQLDAVTRQGVAALKWVLTQRAVKVILERAEALLKEDSTLIELNLADSAATVTVVGDTHGQYHDVCKLFEAAGHPGESSYFVFNGDFVDRGAWGLETLVLLLCWKLALPQRVFLLRGNHESATCTVIYGFKEELKAKYGKAAWQDVYTRCKRVFSVLPLAALVQQNTLVLHGGMFRQQSRTVKLAKGKRKRGNPVLLGTAPVVGNLNDLRAASRGGMDPSGIGSNRLASDVLWSDPTSAPGFQFNACRGIGMTFGPDVTERFLRDNQLRLVLRSHEGPDAREGRDDMAPMTDGYTLDHDTPCGKLMTVFSAPEYPQFVGDEAERCHNRAAVAVLSAPDYATPRMVQFDADLPRPEARPYYALDTPGSDEEFEPAASDLSGMSSIGGTASGASEGASQGGGVVDQPLQQAEQQAAQVGGVVNDEPGSAKEAGGAAGEGPAARAETGGQGGLQGPLGQQASAAGQQAQQQCGSRSVLELFEGVLIETSTDGSKENTRDNDMPSGMQGLQLESVKAAHSLEVAS